MLPIARSLLLLGALVAAADAMPNPYCDTMMLGDETKDYVTFNFARDPSEGKVTIPDRCTRPGRKLAGEFVDVCLTYAKPKLDSNVGGNLFSPVYILCFKDYFKDKSSDELVHCSRTDHRGQLEFQVTQYCEMVVPPNL